MGIRDGDEKIRTRDPGWEKLGSGIRDKHPGSATLKINNQKNGGPKETTCEDIK